LQRQRVLSGRMLAQDNRLEYVLWLSGIFALLILVSLGITIPLVNQRIAGSIRRINRIIRSLAQGDLTRKKVAVRKDEFQDLSRGVNALSSNLNRIAVFAEQIGEGKFDTTFDKLGNNDQLGEALNQMRERLHSVAEEDKKRNWTVVGLAKFSEIFRLSQDVESLAERIILSLSKYINANQGAFFVLEDTDPDEAHHVLNMVSSYAYTAGSGVKRQFRLGEGFVGQAAVEKEVIYISDIPVDYITLTSGLGEALPRCLLIAPLMYNDQVHGVVEFASFANFQPFEIEFVKKLSESIGVALGNLKSQQKTLQLLNASQTLSAELQEKQQKLLENTQVLETNQAIMASTQYELEGQISAVNNAAIVSETDPQGNIIFVNDRFCSVSGYSSTELMGQNHRILKSGWMREEDFRELWGTLEAGRVWHGELKNRNKQGSFYWVEATITPVLSPEGKPRKFISIQFDITQQKTQEEQIRTQLEVSMAQEEELRQNAEEMEAQQEEMRRTQIELTGMINALNNSAIVSTADPQGRIISVNDQFLQVSAYKREELIGQNHRILKSGHQSDDIYESLWKAITKGEVWKGEFKNKAKDNKYYWVTATITPVLDAQRKPVKYIAVTFDVSAQKLQEEQIRAALEISQAQEAELRQNAEELQGAQDEMRKTQIELRGQIGAVNNAGIVAETDLRGNITLVNEEFCRVSGYAREELLGQNHRLLRSGQHDAGFYEALWERITSGEVWKGIFHNKTREDQPYWVKTTITPVLGFDGKPVKYIAVSFDITAQILQQQQLADNAQIMEAQAIELEGQIAALNNAALVTETDLQGNITLVNDETCRMWGYSREEIVGQHTRLVKSDEHDAGFFSQMWQTISSGEVWAGEVKNQSRDGSSVWVQLTITPVKDTQGNVLKYIGVGFDITKNKRQAGRIKMLFQESKEQEKQLRETQIELRGQLNALNNAAIVSETNPEGIITLVNDEATFIWGYGREEVIGQKHNIIKSEEHPERFFKRMWEKITQGQIWQGQVLNRSKSGSTFWVQLTITPVLDEQGQPRKYIGVGFDITSQKEQSLRIKQALEEAAAQEAVFRKEIESLQAAHTPGNGDHTVPAQLPAADVPLALLEVDLNLVILHANAAAEELLGAGASGTLLAQCLTDAEALPDIPGLLFGIARHGRHSCLLPIQPPNGSSQTMFVVFIPVTDTEGTLITLQAWLLPTDTISLTRIRKQPEAILQTDTPVQQASPATGSANGGAPALTGDAHNRYDLATSQPATVETDVTGNILTADEAFCQLYGLTPETAPGRNIRLLRSPATNAGLFFDLWSTIGRGKVWESELINRKGDGTDHWVYLRILPELNESGKPVKYKAQIYDIQPYADSIPYPEKILNKAHRSQN
ncbi:MAG: PAS domain S-box protein, partial [Bacteroidetes bacterium]|nr:PAS domain S-box protein [Bacteroidota bacterium]